MSLALTLLLGACGGDDGGPSESGSGTDASASATSTASTSATSTSSATDTPTTTTETTGPAPIDCGLNGSADQHYFTGTFTLNLSDAPKDATPTGVFDPLLNVEVCFGLTFTPSAPLDEPMAQRRFLLDSVVIKTNDTTGIAPMTFALADKGDMYLRLPEFSPYTLIMAVYAHSPTPMENFSFELACFSPVPFELDDVGLPIFQSMVCEGGTAALRRFEGASSVTDIVTGSTSFTLHVP